MAAKTTCPVTKDQFNAAAKPMPVTLGDHHMTAGIKNFQTGSYGWYGNGKATVTIDGKLCEVQVGVTMTLIGSKPQP